jgi:hypothetical protein
MSLSDLASIGSLASGVAVLVSLVLLYFQLRQLNQQVRQAERNQQATILQSRASRYTDMLLHLTDPSVADAYTKAVRCDADLTNTELGQFMFYARAWFTNSEDAFNQHRDGLLGDRAYRAFLAAFGQNMRHPAYRTVWRMSVWAWGQEFTEFVEKLMVDPATAPSSPTDMMAAYRSGYAAELSGTSIAAAR